MNAAKLGTNLRVSGAGPLLVGIYMGRPFVTNVGAVMFIAGFIIRISSSSTPQDREQRSLGETPRIEEPSTIKAQAAISPQKEAEATGTIERGNRMHCRHCGKEVSENAVGCPSCGMNPATGSERCPSCGAATRPNQVMCTGCGASLQIKETRGWSTGAYVGWLILSFFVPPFGWIYGGIKASGSPAGSERNKHAKHFIWSGVAGMILNLIILASE